MALVDYGYESDDDEDDPAISAPGQGPRGPQAMDSQMRDDGTSANQSREPNHTQARITQWTTPNRTETRQEVIQQATTVLPSPASLFAPAVPSVRLPSPDSLFGPSSGAAGMEAGISRRAPIGGQLGQGGDGRKRAEPSGHSRVAPFQKVPRGSLPSQKVPPDTNKGQLIPPQLLGRKNVATEDLGKLFVQKTKRPADLPP